ncbi:astacin-like metalloprotease toxin 5 [Dermacentor silvarum]|uniref:astacin-like metalloprotease toxin 5 n=1 Tax=Dermacentor silvarum TaxID=543639 RepID=UPI001896AC60|nr:astacin-like metalloprotease toxin 5 [Dermacentor silvarum]
MMALEFFVAAVFLAPALCSARAAPWVEPTTSSQHSGAWNKEQGGLFEGDIMLPEDFADDRAAVTRDAKLWPKGIIPYVFEPRPNRQKRLIREAMEQIEAVSCIRFVNRTTERDYVFIDRNDTCGSYVGRKGGRQHLALGLGCMQIGSVMHELLHVVGFHHEHSRSDRDDYIDVFLDNVQPGRQHNFRKMQPFENRLLSPFDLDSIMLYGSEFFARAPGLFTLLAKDGSRLEAVFNKRRISDSDTRRIRMLYRC